MTVRKTIIINALLAFCYAFTGALMFAPDKLDEAAVVGAVMAGSRAVVGFVMDNRDQTLPMDQTDGS